MKRAGLFFALLLHWTLLPLAAQQHPLVGTWEMISVKGVGADGEPFFLDTTAVRETKIITPTHYMLIAWDVDRDSLIFNRTMMGEVRLDGTRYIETPTQASVQIFDNVKADFTWKLDGDLFTQAGTIVRPDGKSVVLEALIFRRTGGPAKNSGNPAIGTWKQVSGHHLTPEGKKESAFSSSDVRSLIVTPTHWMRMDHNKGKFETVFYGTYSMEGDHVATFLTYSSRPFRKGSRSQFIQKVKSNRLETTGDGNTPGGEKAAAYTAWERVK